MMKARALLVEVTPLKRDCGRICGARCCASLEGEETGMLLFPGEEDLYEDMEGWRIVPAGKELLLICPGECNRKDRPLACRMFPLLPITKDDDVDVRTDERSRAVCPLARQGRRGMDPAFVEAVREAGFVPQVRYVDYNWADPRTSEQMADYMGRTYFAEDENRDALTRETLRLARQHANAEGKVIDNVNTRVAWIWWKTEGNT